MGLKEYLFGFDSESRACEFLVQNGCEIVERNFSSRYGEIDIIARRDGILHFIEVKATSKDYEAIYRLTPQKYTKILKAIDFYLLKNGVEFDFQIDLITIEKHKISWIENISL
ncbi:MULTISPECIES: YraN family protein [unclassified Campylobacter]|uniref:YraN family protein n=1 Tax=unclassified Campylobacter TaxID=2593542 RepID=UPI003D33581C